MESRDRTDRMLHANVKAFEAALKAGKEKVVTPQWPATCLGVLDGSTQDATTLALLAGLARRKGMAILLTAGVFREDAEFSPDEALDDALESLASHGIRAEGVLSDHDESHERVLAVAAKRDPGMIALPCPFSHDLGELSRTTLGTVVEVCLARSDVPVLIARGETDVETILGRPHLVIAEADATSSLATRLGLGLLATGESPQGTLAITFAYGGVEDPDIDYAVARGYATPPADMIPLLSKGLSSFLHRLLLLAEANPGFRLETRLIHRGGDPIDEESESGRLHLLPMAHEEHGVSELVHEFVLSTLDPVIIVPGRVDA